MVLTIANPFCQNLGYISDTNHAEKTKMWKSLNMANETRFKKT